MSGAFLFKYGLLFPVRSGRNSFHLSELSDPLSQIVRELGAIALLVGSITNSVFTMHAGSGFRTDIPAFSIQVSEHAADRAA